MFNSTDLFAGERRILNSVVIGPIVALGCIGNSAIIVIYRNHQARWSAYLVALSAFELLSLFTGAGCRFLEFVTAWRNWPIWFEISLSAIVIISTSCATYVKMFFCIEQLLNVYFPYRLFLTNQKSFKKPILEISLTLFVSSIHTCIWLLICETANQISSPMPHGLKNCFTITENGKFEKIFKFLCSSDFCLFYIIPFVVIATCCLLIVYRVRRLGLDENLFRGVRETQLRIKRSSPNGTLMAERITKSIRALPFIVQLQSTTKLLLTISLFFAISSLPLRILINMMPPLEQIEWIVYDLAIWLWYLNSVACPFTFLLISTSFRTKVTACWKFCWLSNVDNKIRRTKSFVRQSIRRKHLKRGKSRRKTRRRATSLSSFSAHNNQFSSGEHVDENV